MKKFAIVSLVALLVAVGGLYAAVIPPAAPVDEASLVGLYACTGTNPEGMPYEAVTDVVEHEGLMWMRWTFEGGEQMFAVGFIHEERLVMGYYNSAAGVVVYSLSPDTLAGTWVMAGASQHYPETCTRIAVPRPSAAQPGIRL